MHDVLELDDIDDACADELAAGELASIGQDWEVVMQMLPAQWEAKAAELGAVRRLRGCGAWFEWMARELAAGMALPSAGDALLPGRRVRLVDGSSVCRFSA